MIVSLNVHTCRAPRDGRFQARLIVRGPKSRQGIVEKVIEAHSRDAARYRMMAWLNRNDGLSASERARIERQNAAAMAGVMAA